MHQGVRYFEPFECPCEHAETRKLAEMHLRILFLCADMNYPLQGPKRHPAEFKEMRKEWRRQKKEREAAKKASEEAMKQQQEEQQKQQQQMFHQQQQAAAAAAAAAASTVQPFPTHQFQQAYNQLHPSMALGSFY